MELHIEHQQMQTATERYQRSQYQVIEGEKIKEEIEKIKEEALSQGKKIKAKIKKSKEETKRLREEGEQQMAQIQLQTSILVKLLEKLKK